MSVIIKKCVEYDEIKLKKILIEIFDYLGGIENIIKPSMRVALKPNLVMPKYPKDAVTTHPLLVKVLAELIISVGGNPFIIDSPGGTYTKSWLNATYKTTGMTNISKLIDVELNLNLSSSEVINKDFLIQKSVQVLKPLLDADYIINIPKLKTHGMMILTGAVKNMFGAVPGELKAEYHRKYPDYHDFSKSLLDIYMSVTPNLNIMDAIVAMDGSGPSSGDPFDLGLIIASENAFQLDQVAAKIIGLKTSEVPLLKLLVQEKLIDADIDNIKLFGDTENLFKVGGFKIPMRGNPYAGNFFKSTVLKHVLGFIKSKPVIVKKNCTNCNTCYKTCPAKTIHKGKDYPYIILDKCIHCFCCQELCPQGTIKIKNSILLDFLTKIAAILLPVIRK